MLDKFRSLIIGTKRRPYKMAKQRFMPKRGQFESLEERRMLSAEAGYSLGSIDEPILPGESGEVYLSHHAGPGHGGAPNTHFWIETGDAHHFAWQDRNPSTPNVIDIWYDFRDRNGFTNSITAVQMQLALDALTEWENASAGAINFIQNTTTDATNIINIGTGDLAAVHPSFTSAPGGIFGLGGADDFDHSATGDHAIIGGVAWQDFEETWDETIGNGDPDGTIDYYTVVAQEIGHALGLGHIYGMNGPNIMNGGYDGEFGPGAFSADDAAHIRSVYAPLSVINVTLSGTSWATGVEYAFRDLVAAGDQLRPIATQNVNTVEITFSKPVLIDGSELELKWTKRLADGSSQNSTVANANFVYDDDTLNATWTFGNLGDGKYSLELSTDVTDVAGNALDGDWSAIDAGTIDIYSDDPDFAFNVGNGEAGSPDYDMDGDGGEFRLHFALLAGDYDGDGDVDGSDFLLVQSNNPSADGDGNGSAGSGGDFDVWEASLDNMLPLLSVDGDFFDDEWVNDFDLVAWAQGFGPDFNGASFLTWQRMYNSKSVWYVPSSSLVAAASSFATVGLPPQVLNVIVSGSTSPHDPFLMDTVDGSGSQLATVPVGGADTISIVFSEGVNVDANSLMVIGLTTATLPQVAEFSYDVATNTATWRMEGWALGDQYVLSLSDAITDLDGNNLDGEWTNPASITTVNSAVSTFPSGDGLSGGRFNFVMTLLPGDANLDGIVNGADFSIFLDSWWGATNGELFQNADFDGDGTLSMSDFYVLASNWGTNLQDLSILADFNGDYDVDNDDLAVISANIGLTGASWADGDLDGDGQVTLEDLDLAFMQFGLGLMVAS